MQFGYTKNYTTEVLWCWFSVKPQIYNKKSNDFVKIKY